MAFLNERGLSRLWAHIITKLNTKIDKEEGKTLSSNDYTDAEKEKLANLSLEGLATEDYVNQAVSDLVDSAPETLNTLGELAAALEEHADLVETLDAAVTNKVDKEEGKGLSSNDFTNAEKEKLANLGATVQSDWNESDSASMAYILNKPTLLGVDLEDYETGTATLINADLLGGKSASEFLGVNDPAVSANKLATLSVGGSGRPVYFKDGVPVECTEIDVEGASTSEKAETLTNPRSILVNLASNSGMSFDGSSDITPGVTGVLPVSHGGTGVTSASANTFLAAPNGSNGAPSFRKIALKDVGIVYSASQPSGSAGMIWLKPV